MKNLLLFVLTTMLIFTTFSAFPSRVIAQEIKAEKLTNKDLVDMSKSGLPETIILAKIKSSGGNFDTSPQALQELKKEGVSDAVILAVLQPTESVKPGRIKDELTSNFNRLKTSVVTVWSEFGHGTGFIIDKEGLILTNQHVVGPSEYIAVQFDQTRKVRAVLLASSAEKDVAVLWANFESMPDATVATIAKTDSAEPAITEGERVFTIGSPLNKSDSIQIQGKRKSRRLIADFFFMFYKKQLSYLPYNRFFQYNPGLSIP